jgi:hypothetical protein
MRTRITAAAIAAAAFLTLTACNSDDSDDDTNGKTAPTVDMSSIQSAAGFPAEPTGAALTAYLAAIKAAAPSLTDDPGKLIRHGQNQCQAMNSGAANADHAAAERFGNDVTPLTDAQGQAINAALRLTLCPKN